MPSVKLALDHVNEHSAILRNYRLHMWWNDTMVSGGGFCARRDAFMYVAISFISGEAVEFRSETVFFF